MATNSILSGLGDVLLPKGKGVKGGKGAPPGFNPNQPILTAPTYRDHLEDIFNTRTASDSRSLMATLANQDPDVSSAINAFLSVSGSSPLTITAYNENNEVDPEGIKLGQSILALLTTTNDYTIGYSSKPTVDALSNLHRYMILLRGSTACELVLDKKYVPFELRTVDPATLTWQRPNKDKLKPIQTPAGSNEEIDLDIPTFFTSNFHQSPIDTYTYSPFVAAINTIASRQLVINELYRIMKIVGYPRVDISVMEDVLMAAAPPAFRTDPKKIREYVEAELNRVRTAINNLQSSDAFVHSNAIDAKVINDKNPSAGLQIENVIEVLNAQNQAALKVMPAVVGKSDNGQVASTEARLFALNADALNRSVAAIFSKALTLAARLSGYAGRIVAYYPPVELRPQLELEPQMTMRASRLKEDLSLGLITDSEYHMQMYGRPAPDGVEELSGTGFESKKTTIDTEGVSPNGDPLGRSLSGEGGNGVARDNNASAGGGGNDA